MRKFLILGFSDKLYKAILDLLVMLSLKARCEFSFCC